MLFVQIGGQIDLKFEVPKILAISTITFQFDHKGGL